MHSVRCPQCGFLSFADAEICKRCRAPLAPGGDSAPADDFAHADEAAPSGTMYEPTGTMYEPTYYYDDAMDVDAPSRFSRKRVALGAAALACVALVVLVVKGVVPVPFGSPDYAKVISESKAFREPLTIRVARRPFTPDVATSGTSLPGGPPKSAQGVASGAAYVLEGLGLLRIGTSSYESKPLTTEFNGREVSWGKALKSEYVSSISLTDKGAAESSDWAEVEEPQIPAFGGENIPWWRVPLGGREFVKIVSTRTASWEDGGDGVEVVFAWRWKPNRIGEAFRKDSAVQQTLTGKARQIAEALGSQAHAEFEATARLVRDGAGWKVKAIEFWRGEGPDSSYAVPWNR